MIIYLRDADIFKIGQNSEPVEALVNPVNTRGVMGSGLAKMFKDRFPQMFRDYEMACNNGTCSLGFNHVWVNPDPYPKYIINFATKDHWRNPSRIEYIIWGCEDLRRLIVNMKIKSIAIPKIGTGLGGLNWENVRQVLISKLIDIRECQIYLLGASPIA